MSNLSVNDLPFATIVFNNEGSIVASNQAFADLVGADVAIVESSQVAQFFECYAHSKKTASRHDTKPCTMVLTDIKQVKYECRVKKSQAKNKTHLFIESAIPLSELSSAHVNSDPQLLLETIEEAYWEWEIAADSMYYSAKAMEIFGYDTVAYLDNKSFWEKHVEPEYIELLSEQFEEHIAGELPCLSLSYPITTVDGNRKWVSMVGKVIECKNNQPDRVFGCIKDITGEHFLAEQLEEQNNYLELAEKLSHTGHWRFDIVSEELYWSSGIYAIHGVSSQQFTPTVEKAISFYAEAEQEKVRKFLNKSIESGQGFHFKSTIVQPSGKRLKVEALGEVEKNSKGEVVGVFGVFRDITKAEETFEKLKLLAMVNFTIKVPIFFIDERDNIVYQDLSPQIGNQSSVLFNYINFSITDYLDFKSKAKERGQIKKTNISFDNYNTVFDMSITFEADEGIYIWIVENVTEKFKRDQQQIISNRLALLGNTFGTVSHDINNVLGVALGSIEMLELKFSQGEQDISSYIERVKNAIDKGKSVTERLLAFTRKPSVKVVQFDPIREIEENKYLFKQLLLSTITLDLDIEQINCEIKFPQAEFINIILNIVLNAQDAIREQGLLGTISISANINTNNYLEVHIKDSGVGIAKENLQKIFDPFYSSKSVNKGNGIGLANVYNTMYKYNGEIRVLGESDLGGAHFTLLFRCETKGMPAASSCHQDKILSGVINKHILILDDEKSIAEFVSLFLESAGAKTTYVTSKKELEKEIAHGKEYDVFITDMILPDISGREAVALVQGQLPDVKIYSMSGYIGEEDNKWQYPVLRKPFNSKELAEFLVN